MRDHLVLAYRLRHERSRMWRDLLDARGWRPASAAENERVDQLLEWLDLTELRSSAVAALPLGYSRLLEVGRALAGSPRVVLLDEPLSGLDSEESEALAETLHDLVQSEKVSFLLIDHDVDTVLTRSSDVVVLEFGQVIARGTPAEIRDSAVVRSAYLGDSVMGNSVNAGPGGSDDDEHPVLAVSNLQIYYGAALAVQDVSFEVPSGSVVTVLGANGAGKSSVARACSGLVPAKSGSICLNGTDVTKWQAAEIRRAGLVYLPEGRGVFPEPFRLGKSPAGRPAGARPQGSSRSRPAVLPDPG